MNVGDVGRMMKQIQKLQEEMAAMRERLAATEVEGTAGGGAVRVVCTADQIVRKVAIAREAVDADDVEMLEDLVLAATNDALRRARELAEGEMAKLTGGLAIPGLPGFPA
ncbi:MAG: YbaB/EbfC family nucleoid-associated protein [Clostridia bacterium]|nr:YbaB/EbfC family nucleoid-associated protein [Clostridia bacterium]